MKLFVRTLIILAAALVVVGITFTLNQSGVLRLEGPERSDQAAIIQESGTTSSEGTEFAQPERGERPEGGMGIMGMADVLKNLVIVGVIVLVYSWGNTLWRWGRGKWLKPRSPHPANA